jgi:hypothetical protein
VDAGNIIYIVAVIIYFIYSALKKDKSKLPEQGSSDEYTEERKPASFEDLLREIRKSQQTREDDFEKSGQGEVIESKAPRKETYRPLQSTRTEERKIEEQEERYSTSTVYDKYQGEMGDKLVPKRQKLDDVVSIDDPVSRLGIPQLEEVEKEAKVENYYAKLLKNPQSVKDAVILGEILGRRQY